MVEIACEKCGYAWDYSGELHHATCPRCNQKTKTPLKDGETAEESGEPKRPPQERMADAQEQIAESLTRIADALDAGD